MSTMNTETRQAEIVATFEKEIPASLRERFSHLSYGEMAEQPECEDYADLLTRFESEWFGETQSSYDHKFTGLTVGEVSCLIEQFGDDCFDWDKVRGVATVRFASEEDARFFLENVFCQ